MTEADPWIKIPELQNIDLSLLTCLARQSLDCPEAEITRWKDSPVRYLNTETSNLGEFRF